MDLYLFFHLHEKRGSEGPYVQKIEGVDLDLRFLVS